MGCDPSIFCIPQSSKLRVVEVVAVCDGANHLIGRVASSDHGHWALSEGFIALKGCQIALLAKWFQSFDDGLECFGAGCLGVNPQVERLICIGIEDTTVGKVRRRLATLWVARTWWSGPSGICSWGSDAQARRELG